MAKAIEVPKSISEYLKLEDIAERVASGAMSLPSVQRGFVWKPYQIENLWDSLLRGYPTGSFVVSRHSASAEKYELLDGQQRASAIYLGFYNADDPKYSGKFFKTSFENIIIFIDREKPNDELDARKYFFRVITKSHPWGYRKSDNEKPLESENISDAMSSYNIKKLNYLKVDLKEFWPHDAVDPIPLGLFVHAVLMGRKASDMVAMGVLKNNIKKWKDEHTPRGETKVKNEKKPDLYSIEEIFDAVKKMLDRPIIPMQSLELEEFRSVSNNATDDDGSKVNEDESIDEIENLFVRLNSGGTQLRGEELNYSILKSHIDSEVLSQMEDVCRGFIHPARLVTIAFRLFGLSTESVNGKSSISMKIKPKQFQRNMTEGKGDFVKFIQNKIIKNDLVANARKILAYDKESNINGLPFFIANSLAEKAPEVTFLLMYRLLIKNDQLDSDSRNKVLGMITLFMWFGKGGRRKDHKKLLENIWPCAEEFNTKRFWSNETMQRAILDDVNPIRIPALKKIRSILKNKPNIKSWTYKNICKSHPELERFIEEIFYNEDLVLYAQRSTLTQWYAGSENIILDDTNRVFDLDHIAPQSKIENKQNVSESLKDWYPSNGNLRAWPFSLNRHDQDDAPKDKLAPESEKKKKRVRDFMEIGEDEPLTKALLKRSFCDDRWTSLTSKDMDQVRDNDIAKKIIRIIMQRNIEICNEWYSSLQIEDLIPVTENVREKLASVIDRRKWKEDEDAKTEGKIGYYLPFRDKQHYLYFSFAKGAEALEEDRVEFGIEMPKKVKLDVPRKIKEEYKENSDRNSNYVYGEFTLATSSDASTAKMFNDFYCWLKALSLKKDKTIGDDAVNEIRRNLLGGYKVLFEKQKSS